MEKMEPKKFKKPKIEPLPPWKHTDKFKLQPIPPWKHTDKIKIQPMEQESEKKAKYNSKLMSPKGDFAAYQEGEYRRAFPRKMKNDGKTVLSSKLLPYHGADPMEKDRGM